MTGDSEHPPPSQTLGRVFVGRQTELAALRAGLERAMAGRGGVCLVAGEPGIGKSELADRLAADAGARGAEVLWGRSWEGEGAPPYWPWAQILRAYVHARAGVGLEAIFGAATAYVAQVVPEIRERLPELPVPPPLDSEQARFRLFDSITTFLTSAAGTRPLVLVLDDLHWADKPTLLLHQGDPAASPRRGHCPSRGGTLGGRGRRRDPPPGERPGGHRAPARPAWRCVHEAPHAGLRHRPGVRPRRAPAGERPGGGAYFRGPRGGGLGSCHRRGAARHRPVLLLPHPDPRDALRRAAQPRACSPAPPGGRGAGGALRPEPRAAPHRTGPSLPRGASGRRHRQGHRLRDPSW